jgi:hypothetical protein
MKEGEGEGFEEWDADFLDQLIQVEELALSSQLPSSSESPLPPTTATTKLPYLPPPQQLQHDYQNNSISYSPPRELSQRPTEFSINNNSSSITFDRFSNGFSHSAPSTSASKHNAKDLEIDRLKVFSFILGIYFICFFLWIHIFFLWGFIQYRNLTGLTLL